MKKGGSLRNLVLIGTLSGAVLGGALVHGISSKLNKFYGQDINDLSIPSLRNYVQQEEVIPGKQVRNTYTLSGNQPSLVQTIMSQEDVSKEEIINEAKKGGDIVLAKGNNLMVFDFKANGNPMEAFNGYLQMTGEETPVLVYPTNQAELSEVAQVNKDESNAKEYGKLKKGLRRFAQFYNQKGKEDGYQTKVHDQVSVPRLKRGLEKIVGFFSRKKDRPVSEEGNSFGSALQRQENTYTVPKRRQEKKELIETRVSHYQGLYETLSPDGKEVLYLSAIPGSEGKYGMYIRDVNDKDQSHARRVGNVKVNLDGMLKWAPNGSAVAYITGGQRARLVRDENTFSNTNLVKEVTQKYLVFTKDGVPIGQYSTNPFKG